ncbi:RNA polymerase II C-terminal domain phosphatase-like 4 [Papaver somniferum]|uniref:RNA polymerase II C-terminal domain phosphatase-like 4 n=1 Tax=Papaver somniferum TaxID=3469 RepID=UPI000E6F5F88|nr:RNA polymerase II C-terminal domain phosphatase-like 4 [Papaver somniferum]XP_026432304.1 RNA polymerase II C-terminal domain phosphatase-like 4 [Papaver somniferum]
MSTTTVIPQVQQKRKMINTQDCGFQQAQKVKRVRIRYTPYLDQPPLIDFTKNLSSYKDKQESVEKPSTMKIRIKYNPPTAVPPLMVREELSFNKKENERLIRVSKLCGNTFRKAFFGRKKLCLVLDLDHTLLHSVRIKDVSVEDQEYLNLRVSSMKDLDGNNLYRQFGRYTKLRPHTREFLTEASKYFELFIYTMGGRDYARDMGTLLDPHGVLFKKSNIVSKDDSTKENRKNLDILAGPNELNTIIVDDTKRVWEKNRRNLIQIEKYNYLTEGDYRLKKDDEQRSDDEDGALKSITEILQGVHNRFFELFPVPVELQEYIKSVDIRPVLQGFLK